MLASGCGDVPQCPRAAIRAASSGTELERILTEFVRALRKADVPVSPAETLDAMQVAEVVGMHDRTRLRHALAMTLAKSPEEKARFDLCFERFFSFAPFASTHTPTVLIAPSNPIGANGDASDETATSSMSMAELLLQGDRGELAFRIARAARAVDMSELRALRDKSTLVFRLLEVLDNANIDAQLSAWSANENTKARAVALRAAKALLQKYVREYVELQYLLRVDASGRRTVVEAAIKAQLTAIQPAYYDEIRAVVRRIALKLTTQHRRRRKRAHRGHLDVRRTLRRNLGYDGALFDLHWRRVKVERPKIFALCDVSGSVAKVARFMLLLLYSLHELLPNIRTFAFSNQLGEVSALFDRLPLERAIEEALIAWGKGTTDYARSFMDFRTRCLKDIDQRSTVIVLGDGRNNYFDPRSEVLAEISARAKQVLWLNPEPEEQWRVGDSEMARFTPYCFRTVRCSSLQDLERFADSLLSLA